MAISERNLLVVSADAYAALNDEDAFALLAVQAAHEWRHVRNHYREADMSGLEDESLAYQGTFGAMEALAKEGKAKYTQEQLNVQRNVSEAFRLLVANRNGLDNFEQYYYNSFEVSPDGGTVWIGLFNRQSGPTDEKLRAEVNIGQKTVQFQRMIVRANDQPPVTQYEIIGHRHSAPGIADFVLERTIKLMDHPDLKPVYKKGMEGIFQDAQQTIASEKKFRDWLRNAIQQGQGVPAIAIEMSKEELADAVTSVKTYMQMFRLVFKDVWPDSYKEKADEMGLYLFGPVLTLFEDDVIKEDALKAVDSEEFKKQALYFKDEGDRIAEQLPKNAVGVKSFKGRINTMLNERKQPTDTEIGNTVKLFARSDRSLVNRLMRDAIKAADSFLDWGGAKREQFMAEEISRLPQGSIFYVGSNHVAGVKAILEKKGFKAAVKFNKDGDSAMLFFGDSASNENLGGIDLNDKNFNLRIQNNGGTINFEFDPAMVQKLQNMPGFSPVIIDMRPLSSMQLFLGLQGGEEGAST